MLKKGVSLVHSNELHTLKAASLHGFKASADPLSNSRWCMKLDIDQATLILFRMHLCYVY